tara:strand:+ start:64 stop:714 length:651 start_codon:yes stop_codon:yes gene_type:complete
MKITKSQLKQIIKEELNEIGAFADLKYNAVSDREKTKLQKTHDIGSGKFADSVKLQGEPMSDKVKKVVNLIQKGQASVKQGNLLQAAQGLCSAKAQQAQQHAMAGGGIDVTRQDGKQYTLKEDEIDDCFPSEEGEDPELWRGFSKQEFADAYMWLFPTDAIASGVGMGAIMTNMMKNPTFKAPEDWQRKVKKKLRPNDPEFDCKSNAEGGYDCWDT